MTRRKDLATPAVTAGTGHIPAPPAPARGRAPLVGLKVRATQPGYIYHTRRRTGDVFTIATEAEFAATWMEVVDPDTPERLTLGNAALRQEHDVTLALRSQSPGERSEGTRHDLPPAALVDDNPLDA